MIFHYISSQFNKFQINEETSDVIVNKAIELWQQSGSVLVTMSPSTINMTLN